MVAPMRRAGRNMMLFASEVPVISAMNPYRKIEDVFFDVWKRTYPKQVQDVHESLELEVLTPEQKMFAVVEDLGVKPSMDALLEEASTAKTTSDVASVTKKIESNVPASTPESIKKDVVQFLSSEMNKQFGSRSEAPAIDSYQAQTKVEVGERNLVFSKRKIGKIGAYNVLVGGRIDGRADGRVIEVKNRLKQFKSPLPEYDVAQLQTYLYILDAKEGELVEYLKQDRAKTKVTKVARDDKMWQEKIEPYLLRFSSALTHFMKDGDSQKLYVQSAPADQKEIIRQFWMQDVLVH